MRVWGKNTSLHKTIIYRQYSYSNQFCSTYMLLYNLTIFALLTKHTGNYLKADFVSVFLDLLWNRDVGKFNHCFIQSWEILKLDQIGTFRTQFPFCGNYHYASEVTFPHHLILSSSQIVYQLLNGRAQIFPFAWLFCMQGFCQIKVVHSQQPFSVHF